MTDPGWPPPDASGGRSGEDAVLQAVDLGRLLASANRGELRPQSPAMSRAYRDAIYAWAVLACEQARWSDARVALNHLSAAEQGSSRCLRALLAVCVAMGESKAAVEVAQRLLEAVPGDCEVAFLLGQALTEAGHPAQGREQILVAQQLALSDTMHGATVSAWCDAWLHAKR